MAGSRFWLGAAGFERRRLGRRAPAERQDTQTLPDVDMPPEGRKRFRRLEWLAWLLDRSIPIGKWRIGLDPIIGLMPGAGDWIGAMLSVYVLYEGARLGVHGGVLARMAGNILVETIIGAIPLLGDAFDFAWQANTRNLTLIREHYRPELKPRSLGWVWSAVLGTMLAVLVVIAAAAYLLIRAVVGLIH